ncbi:MAG TPA: hypothetical protein VEF03_02500, partial [Candidatus Binataceae bacterium]|nr:hypothetical protein [Candidatus Binataceae bacterium]
MDGEFFRYAYDARGDSHSRRRRALAMSLSVAAHAAIIAILVAIVPAVERHDGSFIVARLIGGGSGAGGESGAGGAAHARSESTPSVHLTRAAQHPIHNRREPDPPRAESIALKSAEPPREVPESGLGKSINSGTTAGTGDSQSSHIGGAGDRDGIGKGGVGGT